MPPNTERNGSESSEREELHAQCQAVLEEVSNANSIDIQTADIRSPQYQFQILASNVYIQTLPKTVEIHTLWVPEFRKACWSNILFDEDYVCIWSRLYPQLRYTYPALSVHV